MGEGLELSEFPRQDQHSGTISSRRLPTSEWAYQVLREKILSGEMHGGERLIELSLASDLGVSRTPIREALKRLTGERLIAVDPVMGLIVKPMEPREVEDLYTIRESIDGLAASLAASRISPAELARLRVLLEVMEDAARDGQKVVLVRANMLFHEAIFQACDNEHLVSIGRGLTDFVRRISSVLFHQDQRRDFEVVEEHRAIIEALARHDAEAARRAAAHHMLRAKEQFVANQARMDLLGPSDPIRRPTGFLLNARRAK